MCLYKTHIFPKRAKKDIIVYKALKYSEDTRSYYTPFRQEDVIFNTTLKSKKSIFKGIFKKHIQAEGVHSERTLFYATRFRWNLINPTFIFVAIIPKGSYYYIGEDGDMASNKLVITDRKVK